MPLIAITFSINVHVDGLVQDCSISIVNSLSPELIETWYMPMDLDITGSGNGFEPVHH